MTSNTYHSEPSHLSSFRAKASVGVLAVLALTGSVRSAIADPMLAFQDVINTNDPTFNQELGINNSGLIAGYFGSGMAGHPNKGYTTASPYTSFTNENFGPPPATNPPSVQTQVTGLNNIGTTVGFFSNTNNGVGFDDNFGWVNVGGVFTEANDPNASPVLSGLFTDQLLGVNDSNVAVGFYVADDGTTHGYTYNIKTNTFSGPIDDPNGVGTTTAAAINNSGEIAGFFTSSSGATEGFLDNMGVFTTVDVPGSMTTALLGLNNNGEAVGFDVDAMGNMHGIICNVATLTCVQQDDPNGIDTTTFNGVNDSGQIVGFYVNGAGNTIGLVATPVPEPSSLTLLLGVLTGLGAISFWRRRAS